MIIVALQELRPNAEWTMTDDVITWLDTNQTQPTQQEIDDKVAELQTKYANEMYKRLREYPPIEEQLDMQYWDSVNGTTVWSDTIKAVKDKFPK